MAKQKQAYLGVFENMDFEPYKFQEYPKVVGYRDVKKTDPIMVSDAREEVEFITHGSPGALKSREDELTDELERKRIELEFAKKELEEIKAKQEQMKSAAKPLAPLEKKV
jgi:hypothetical protein